jgi:hypothetical protein
VKTDAAGYSIDVYRLGYYGGLGARKVATLQPSATLPQSQPACLSDATTGLVDCGNWAESASWDVPSDAVSGVYVAVLRRADTGGTSHVVFVVRDDDGGSDVLVQTSDTTWQAYNRYGGNSLYTGAPAGRAYKVSYNRPLTVRGYETNNSVFATEYPLIRWLERNGYDVSYTSGVDTARRGGELFEHEVFVSSGHDEYWSGAQRANVEAARDAGVDLVFLSGNEVFWKTRWEPSIAAGGQADRTLVSYKETHANAKIDPDPTWTGTWRDPRFSPPSDGGRPENALTGTIFTVNSPRDDSITVPAEYGKLRFWRHTSIANLAPGSTATLPAGSLGYEWDEDLDNGSRPVGLIRLSRTTVSVDRKMLDFGSTYGPGVARHSLTLYRKAGGGLVFGAGTVQWSWFLDSTHDGPARPTDGRMQQATVNVLADMGAQPTTLQPGLVQAQASTDSAAPTSTITSPVDGSSVGRGSTVTVEGTAADSGGEVGGVEVSTDNGGSWHPADGTTTWSYTFIAPQTGNPTLRIKSRAADDSGNVEQPGGGVAVAVGCPCSLWTASTTPATPASSDGNAVEVGVKFRADSDGVVRGIRFYKGSSNTGTHVGSLWSAAGTLLGRATFTGESATGWQTVTFAQPVAVAANTTYVASYFAPNGSYALTRDYFAASAYDNAPLHALRDGQQGGNGVYRYTSSPAFPNQTYGASNYWVDVVYDTGPAPPDTTPPHVAGVEPAAGAAGVGLGTNVSASFDEPLDATTVTATTVQLRGPGGALVAATVAYDVTSRTATLDPAAALGGSTTYTATVKGGASGVKDVAGNPLAADETWSFTTAAADTTPPQVTGVSPPAGSSGAPVDSNVTANFSEPVDSATVSGSTFELRGPGGALVSAAVTYDAASRTAVLDPAAALATSTSYTATVKGGPTGVRDAAGNALAADETWSFQSAAPGGCPCSLWSSSVVPAVTSSSDGGSVELGVKFRSDQAGVVTGVRFYKGPSNTGTHVGSLWSASGALLAQATFTGESGSGWQSVSFSVPVAIAADTTYVASYHAPNGGYALNRDYFATSGFDNAPLHALRDGQQGGNGVFRYGASSVFPDQTYGSSNYWVDVLFVPA